MLSPLLKLSQGFSYVQTEDGNVLKSITQIKEKENLSVYVTDGVITASVESVKEEQHGR